MHFKLFSSKPLGQLLLLCTKLLNLKWYYVGSSLKGKADRPLDSFQGQTSCIFNHPNFGEISNVDFLHGPFGISAFFGHPIDP
jgi:hypothetical protein